MVKMEYSAIYDDAAGIIIIARAHSLLVVSGTQQATRAESTELWTESEDPGVATLAWFVGVGSELCVWWGADFALHVSATPRMGASLSSCLRKWFSLINSVKEKDSTVH